MTKLVHKNFLPQPVFSVAFFIVLFPHESRADAISPLSNLFTPDTAVPASIITVLIILVEALLLWKWIKPISFRVSLWRATIINIISSAAGSMAAWLFIKEQMIWGIMGLYIPMFFLTLVTETPALKFLYRQSGFDWKRSIKVSLGLNLISYLLVFIAQFGLFFAYLGYAGLADKHTIKTWNDTSLIEGETGFIYTVKYAPTEEHTKYVFNRYDVEHKKWETVDLGFEKGIYPTIWDVKGNVIACIVETGDWENRPITVLNSRTHAPVAEINGNFRDVRISPDLTRLAVLEYVREANAPKDEQSHYMLGSSCQLRVYAIESGTLLYEAPRMSLSEGLAWSNDSNKVIFASLRDDTLFQYREDESHTDSYGRGYAKRGQFPIDLFVFNLETNSVTNLVEGKDPNALSINNDFTFLRETGMYKNELWRMDIEKRSPRLILNNVGGYRHAVSPGGEKYLIMVPHKQPFSSSYFLTLVDPDDEERKFIIAPDIHYGFRWINKK